MRCLVLPAISVMAVIAFFSALTPIATAAITAKPDQVRAAFIYNLTNFVNWRDREFIQAGDCFTIQVLGNRTIARNLKLLTDNEKIWGRPFKIEYRDSPAQINNCHILYMDNSVTETISPDLIRELNESDILTIGDSSLFLEKGGIIALIEKNKRIQVVINLSAAKKTGFSFDAQLLKVARIFSPSKEQ